MGKTVIGITGIYASGKSTVAAMLAEKGAEIIDADKIGHEVLCDKDVKDRILSEWGEVVLVDGEVDRKVLGEKVFVSEEEIEKLCAITHPSIIARIRDRIKKSDSAVVVVDAPLLLEAGLEGVVDKIVVVKASLQTCLKRAVSRGVSEEKVIGVMKTQMSAEEKEKRADHIIDNDNDLELTKKGVERLWREI